MRFVTIKYSAFMVQIVDMVVVCNNNKGVVAILFNWEENQTVPRQIYSLLSHVQFIGSFNAIINKMLEQPSAKDVVPCPLRGMDLHFWYVIHLHQS